MWFVSCSAGLVTFYPFRYRECALGQTLSQSGGGTERRKQFSDEPKYKSHGVVSCINTRRVECDSKQDRLGGIHFAPGSREPEKVSGALMFNEGFEEEEEGILLGLEADGDNHFRLFGCVTQNQSENSKGERKLQGTDLRTFITSSLPMWRPSSSTGGLCGFL